MSFDITEQNSFSERLKINVFFTDRKIQPLMNLNYRGHAGIWRVWMRMSSINFQILSVSLCKHWRCRFRHLHNVRAFKLHLECFLTYITMNHKWQPATFQSFRIYFMCENVILSKKASTYSKNACHFFFNGLKNGKTHSFPEVVVFFFVIFYNAYFCIGFEAKQRRVVSLRLAPSALTNFLRINSTLAICGHDKEGGFLVTDHL